MKETRRIYHILELWKGLSKFQGSKISKLKKGSLKLKLKKWKQEQQEIQKKKKETCEV